MNKKQQTHTSLNNLISSLQLEDLIHKSWDKIAPFWPLKSLIAVNPLKGFEELPFEKALLEAEAYFEQSKMPKEMRFVNRQTIKWLQVFFDEGQSTFKMPFKEEGLYSAWIKLIRHDQHMHQNKKERKNWIKNLPLNSSEAIASCLTYLNASDEEALLLMTLLLTTLPGWASYIKYHADWNNSEAESSFKTLKEDYIAMRLILLSLSTSKASTLTDWHRSARSKLPDTSTKLEKIQETEKAIYSQLIENLPLKNLAPKKRAHAQFIFCIDVRSEPIRRALEHIGPYETFGYAGFFGIPLKVEDTVKKTSYASCPVLLQPQHCVKKIPTDSKYIEHALKGHQKSTQISKTYQSLAYNFSTPFALVETLGLFTGIWLGIKTLFPKLAYRIRNQFKNKVEPQVETSICLSDISFEDQCRYAKSALEMIGLTENFAPLVVLCGHGSTTENNPYASMLDCGACGGNNGSNNAKALAQILNRTEIRHYLSKYGVKIPSSTLFIAGQHNTTRNKISLFISENLDPFFKSKIKKVQTDLETLFPKTQETQFLKSINWSETRPEWGLTTNAAFIAGPRSWTQGVNLEGRAFLHSYNPHQDEDGKILEAILTAPMVVAQWINSQYLFSTLDNVAYGAGSKITKNPTGKIGIMQGNGSDLMHGLPLQSLFRDDQTPFHEPVRLMTFIYAPKDRVHQIVEKHPTLKQFAQNGWVHFTCIEPKNEVRYVLNRDLSWSEFAIGQNTKNPELCLTPV